MRAVQLILTSRLVYMSKRKPDGNFSNSTPGRSFECRAQVDAYLNGQGKRYFSELDREQDEKETNLPPQKQTCRHVAQARATRALTRTPKERSYENDLSDEGYEEPSCSFHNPDPLRENPVFSEEAQLMEERARYQESLREQVAAEELTYEEAQDFFSVYLINEQERNAEAF